ncbi:response regulator transcription factor [Terrimonas pollutisoli]|uniref:response regulator transcription factor n=1 Tax=Terrimonas pollutisoli TaxID=3034147 RepID=UPI0023EDDFDD|nr:response regulator transcription factor [Terrimonas sp. H1YJ31]
MAYKEFIPGDALKQYVKCYYIFESDSSAVFEDKAFATGCMEIMFNLGTGRWQTASGGDFKTTPHIELWGQIIQPLTFRSLGKNTMLGIRFYPHTASTFLNTDVSLLNNQVTDLMDVAGKQVHTLHSRLLDITSMHERIKLVEEFLLNRLSLLEKKLDKIILVNNVMKELKREDFFNNIGNVASRYGVSSRYLQKIFLQYTGLTPKLYSKINRFQNSLQLVANGNLSLTSIAYECDYFDQSHFIREFKSFTGLTPSAFNPESSSAILISPN